MSRLIRLYEGMPAPYDEVAEPLEATLEIFPGTDPDGWCVISCPGGGYWHLCDDYEGTEIAEACVARGTAGAVLRYRTTNHGYDYRAILTDLFRAVRYMRYHAAEGGYAPDKIAVLGFSAGGHLAAMAAEQWDGPFADHPCGDAVDEMSSRPDGVVVCYGVGNFTEDALCMGDSRKNFLGGDFFDPDARRRYSSDLGARPDMSPAYIWHHREDQIVPYQNAERLAAAMTAVGVRNRLHLFDGGRHGGGLWIGQPAGVWLDEALAFLRG